MVDALTDTASPESIWADLTSEIESDSVSRFKGRIQEINADFASRGLRNSSMWIAAQADAASAELESVAREISTSMRLLVTRLRQRGESIPVPWLELHAKSALDACAARLAPSADGERLANQVGLLGVGMVRHLQPGFEKAVMKQRNAMGVIAESLVSDSLSTRAALLRRPLESIWGILAAIAGVLSFVAMIVIAWRQSRT